MLKTAKKYFNLIFQFLKKVNELDALFYIILISAFVVRVVNLNYNSAFNDEAIYIVVGRMGLFTQDWWSYGAKLWMAALIPFILAGIILSRNKRFKQFAVLTAL